MEESPRGGGVPILWQNVSRTRGLGLLGIVGSDAQVLRAHHAGRDSFGEMAPKEVAPAPEDPKAAEWLGAVSEKKDGIAGKDQSNSE